MDELLLFLAEKGALQTPVLITTKSLGRVFSMSQQNASVRLRKLEEKALLQRTKHGLKITEKGRKQLFFFYSRTKAIFNQKHFVFSGIVVKGLDKGRHYISIPQYKKGIKECTGFTPYPGTLNIELDDSQLESRVALRDHKPWAIKGFKHRGKSFGPVELYACNINGYKGAILFPFHSHHGLKTLELISPFELSKKFPTSPGSKIKVEVIFP